MNIDVLISLVQERRSLWDTSSKSYHNRDDSRRKWMEIAEIMQLESGAVKAKWGNLRDMFRKEHTKQMKQPIDSEAKVCTWKFYEQLSFLCEVLKSRKMIGNIDAPFEQSLEGSTLVEQDEVGEEPSPLQDGIGNHALSNCAIDTEVGKGSSSRNTFKAPATKKDNDFRTNAMANFLTLEEKVAILEQMKNKSSTASSNEIQDEDYHFLMSLLPHFREIPAHRKLEVGIRIQQVLLEERNNQNQHWAPTPTTSPHSSQDGP